jgi:hypothetical protein
MVLGVCRSVLRDPMRPRMPSRPRSWSSPAGPADSGCGTRWVRGLIRLRTAWLRAPARPRGGDGGTSSGRVH